MEPMLQKPHSIDDTMTSSLKTDHVILEKDGVLRKGIPLSEEIPTIVKEEIPIVAREDTLTTEETSVHVREDTPLHATREIPMSIPMAVPVIVKRVLPMAINTDTGGDKSKGQLNSSSSYEVSLAEDFSELVDHINVIQIGTPSTPTTPITPTTPYTPITPITPLNTGYHTSTNKHERFPFTTPIDKCGYSEKTQMNSYHHKITNYNDVYLTPHYFQPSNTLKKSHSRHLSTSSRISQKSIKRKNHLQQKPVQLQQYVKRSYDEMMRIPDIYERLSFYEKTIDLCLRAESPIAQWMAAMKIKGIPSIMNEGYIPPPRGSLADLQGCESYSSMTSSFSGSISMFLKKAGGSQTNSKRHYQGPKSFLSTSQSSSMMGSGLFSRSSSRYSLSSANHMPKYEPNNNNHDFIRKTPMMANTSMRFPSRRGNPMSIQMAVYNKPRSASISLRTSSLSASTTLHEPSNPLSYMIATLPQYDLDTLKSALDEAKGDPMAAISLAVSYNKQKSNYDLTELQHPSCKIK
ncbi:hypothetical protein BDB01DRAFT_774869 [Pilobolus umbonatus]|nr:hypothetical protein BDB01DRAFT_774869 [Pilobolus umbonatus]